MTDQDKAVELLAQPLASNYEAAAWEFCNQDKYYASATALLDQLAPLLTAQAVEAERAACTKELRLAVAAGREAERERCAKVAVDAVARFPVVIHRKEILRGRMGSGEYLDTAQGYVTKEDCLAFWAKAAALINAPEVAG